MNVLSLKHIRVDSFKQAITRLAWFSFILSIILTGTGSAKAQSPCASPIAVRPILFVHGFMEDSSAWGADAASGLRGDIISSLSAEPGYSNPQNYNLYYSNIDSNVHLSTADNGIEFRSSCHRKYSLQRTIFFHTVLRLVGVVNGI